MSPVPFADFVTSTTHKTLRGPRGGFILCKESWSQKIDQAVFPGIQGGPLMHVIAAKAVAFREALRPEFKSYAAQTVANAKTLAYELQRLGFRIVSGGTDNHLLLVDVVNARRHGQAGRGSARQGRHHREQEQDSVRPEAAARSVGIRIGTPALTTRGMREPEMRRSRPGSGEVLSAPNDTAVAERVRGQVQEMGGQFPAPA